MTAGRTAMRPYRRICVNQRNQRIGSFSSLVPLCPPWFKSLCLHLCESAQSADRTFLSPCPPCSPWFKSFVFILIRVIRVPIFSVSCPAPCALLLMQFFLLQVTSAATRRFVFRCFCPSRRMNYLLIFRVFGTRWGPKNAC